MHLQYLFRKILLASFNNVFTYVEEGFYAVEGNVKVV